MILFNKYILFFLYALYSICSVHIANCESLTSVCDYNLTKIDKSLGWTFLLGTIFFIGYYYFTGDSPSPDNLAVAKYFIKNDEPKQADDSDDITFSSINSLKDSEYLKTLEILTKYPK